MTLTLIIEGAYVVCHEDQHEKEWQEYANTIKHRADRTRRECEGDSIKGRLLQWLQQVAKANHSPFCLPRCSPPWQQPRILNLTNSPRTVASLPGPCNRYRCLRPVALQTSSYPLIDNFLDLTEKLIQYAQTNDDKEGDYERKCGCDVPLRKYYACVNYVGVPVCPCQFRVNASMFMGLPEHIHRASRTHVMTCVTAMIHCVKTISEFRLRRWMKVERTVTVAVQLILVSTKTS